MLQGNRSKRLAYLKIIFLITVQYAVGRLFLYYDNYNRNKKCETNYVFHITPLLSLIIKPMLS